MPQFIEQLGQTMASGGATGLLGAGMGLMLQGQQDRRQINQQRRLQNLEIKGQKDMTDYNMAKQLQMWKDTNYPAQMEQLKLAGLNPGLIYGMGGAGGSTTGQASGNVTGGHAPVGGGEIAMGIQSMAQLSLIDAQRRNIEADTKNKLADIPVKEATVPKIQAETASLAQGVQNLQAQEALTRVDTELRQVQASVARQTINDAMQTIENTAKKSFEELQALRIENDLSREQYHDKVKMLKLQLSHIALQNALTKAQESNVHEDTKLKMQKILESKDLMKYWANQIALGWGNLDHEQFRTGQFADDKDLGDKILEFLPGIILGPLGKSGGGNPVKGFHKR